MSNAETAVMREILCAVSALPESLWWRQNAGVFRSFSGREVVRVGIPGMADIGGMFRGKAVQIEVKTPEGRLSLEQKRWKAATEKAGGIFILGRDPAGVLEKLAALDAQSGERRTNKPGLEAVQAFPVGVAVP
jgi:hypothetical protein